MFKLTRKNLDKFTNSCAIAICNLCADNSEVALPYFQKAAIEDNCEFAQFYMGEMYTRGLGGLRSDHISALPWYEMAAEQGLGPAQQAAGNIYYHQAKFEPLLNKEQYKFVKSRYQQWFKKTIAQGCVTKK